VGCLHAGRRCRKEGLSVFKGGSGLPGLCSKQPYPGPRHPKDGGLLQRLPCKRRAGIYGISRRATDEFEAAREKIAAFIGAGRDELMLLRNSSEALNLIASGVQFRRGDRVVITIQEHHSNFVVWQRAKERLGIDLRIVKSDRQGLFNLSDFEAASMGRRS